jgi:ATP-dependent Clp protease adaptor protein ClpS
MGPFFRRQKVVVVAKPRLAAAPRTDDEVRQVLALLPRYRVVLHNDDVNDMEHVVVALMHVVTSLDIEHAIRIMFEAHNQGRAEVVICLKELAEHYAVGLQRCSLTSTIEPA